MSTTNDISSPSRLEPDVPLDVSIHSYAEDSWSLSDGDTSDSASISSDGSTNTDATSRSVLFEINDDGTDNSSGWFSDCAETSNSALFDDEDDNKASTNLSLDDHEYNSGYDTDTDETPIRTIRFQHQGKIKEFPLSSSAPPGSPQNGCIPGRAVYILPSTSHRSWKNSWKDHPAFEIARDNNNNAFIFSMTSFGSKLLSELNADKPWQQRNRWYTRGDWVPVTGGTNKFDHGAPSKLQFLSQGGQKRKMAKLSYVDVAEVKCAAQSEVSRIAYLKPHQDLVLTKRSFRYLLARAGILYEDGRQVRPSAVKRVGGKAGLRHKDNDNTRRWSSGSMTSAKFDAMKDNDNTRRWSSGSTSSAKFEAIKGQWRR